jgi:hypothetical protein
MDGADVALKHSPFLFASVTSQFTRKVIKLTVVIIKEYHGYQLHTKLYPVSFSQG